MSLQTLNHIPNSDARRQELEHRLRNHDRPDRLQLLLLALDDPYPPLRHHVAESLQVEFNHSRGQAPLDEALLGFLESIALGKAPDSELLEALRFPDDLLSHQSARARICACVALEASYRPGATAERVSPLLDCDLDDLRYQALITTYRLLGNSERLRDHVLHALDDADPEVVVVATQIAVKFEWGELLPDFLHARARLHGEDRTQITFSIGELIDSANLSASDLPESAHQDLVAECIDALSHEPHTAAAARTLANLDAQQACDDLAKITKKWLVHPILKVEAAAALIDLGHPKGEAYLAKALRSRRRDDRGYALRVIGKRQLHRFFGDLVDTATDDGYHADTATLALADFGGPQARDILEDLSQNHRQLEVQRLARRALIAPTSPNPLTTSRSSNL